MDFGEKVKFQMKYMNALNGLWTAKRKTQQVKNSAGKDLLVHNVNPVISMDDFGVILTQDSLINLVKNAPR